MRKVIKALLILVAGSCMMGTAYTPIANETGAQLRNDINLRFAGGAPTSPTYTTVIRGL